MLSTTARTAAPGSKARAVAIATASLIAIGVVVAGGDGTGDRASAAATGGQLTIYSSLPLQGSSRSQSQAVIRGEKLALADVGFRVGALDIRFVSLDDSTAQNPGTADEAATARNARRAAQDPSAILYLGEFNSGGTKVSLPILNAAGVAQISPSNTYVGVTTDAPGSAPGEPAKYYPTGKRTYARVLPNDTVQGAALATLMRQDGCTTATLWNDRSSYGRGLAANVKRRASAIGLRIENERGTRSNATNYRSIASKVRSGCFLWAGTTFENGVQVYKDVARAARKAKLYGPDGVVDEAFTNPRRGGIPTAVARRTKLVVATLGARGLPKAAGFVRRYKQLYRTKSVDPYAIYGYETMALGIDALTRAGANAGQRDAVVDALFATKDRQSVLGRYSIDANGDTTLADYGVYVITKGLPRYSRKVVANNG